MEEWREGEEGGTEGGKEVDGGRKGERKRERKGREGERRDGDCNKVKAVLNLLF